MASTGPKGGGRERGRPRRLAGCWCTGRAMVQKSWRFATADGGLGSAAAPQKPQRTLGPEMAPEMRRDHAGAAAVPPPLGFAAAIRPGQPAISPIRRLAGRALQVRGVASWSDG